MSSEDAYYPIENVKFINSSIVFHYPCPKDTVTCYGLKITLPQGFWCLEVWGASGGDAYHTPTQKIVKGGKGGYSIGVLKISSDTELYLTIGGKGTSNYTGAKGSLFSGGFNGGGSAYYGKLGYPGGSGGGSTDIRMGGIDLSNRIIVAGGGGGAGAPNKGQVLGSFGGAGGGLKGLNGGGWDDIADGSEGKGASQDHGGEGGFTPETGGTSESGMPLFGGDASIGHYSSGGSGGGGYFGGGGSNAAGGGGGSGFVRSDLRSYLHIKKGTFDGNQTIPKPFGGYITGNEGNGYVRIRYIDTNLYSFILAHNPFKFHFVFSLQLMTLISIMSS